MAKTQIVELDVVDRLVKKFETMCASEGVKFELSSVGQYKSFGHTSVNIELSRDTKDIDVRF